MEAVVRSVWRIIFSIRLQNNVKNAAAFLLAKSAALMVNVCSVHPKDILFLMANASPVIVLITIAMPATHLQTTALFARISFISLMANATSARMCWKDALSVHQSKHVQLAPLKLIF
jgi:hypothetical protein